MKKDYNHARVVIVRTVPGAAYHMFLLDPQSTEQELINEVFS
jgi:hypothetical protein